MSDTSQSKLVSNHRLNWLWLIPVIALGLVAFIVWRNLPAQGEKITLYFDDVESLSPVQTKLKYRGLEVGQVEALRLTEDHQSVEVDLKVDDNILPLLQDTTTFWLVKPEIGASGISGINTLVSGPYITFSAGEGNAKRKFVAAQSSPLEKPDSFKFKLSSGLKNSIEPGDPLYYKQVVVGSVYAYELRSDRVIFYVQIQPEYQSLLRKNSVFWEDSGLEVDVGLTGISVSTAPLMNLLSGGISFSTPTEYGALALANSEFTVHPDKEDDWTSWEPKISLPDIKLVQKVNTKPDELPEALDQVKASSGDN